MGFSLAIYFFYARYRQDEFFDRLQKKAYTTARLLTAANGVSPELLRAMDQNELTVLFAEEISIYDASGRIIFESGDHPYPIAASVLPDIQRGKILRLREGEKEIAIIPYRQGAETLVVAIYAIDRYGFNKLERLRNSLFIGWFISIVVTLLAGRFFAGKALEPVSYIVNQVQGISASNIHARLEKGQEQDELSQLAQTFNDMLARLEEGFYLQKSFVSHASHELRTPLAIMMSQIEVARMQKRTADHYETVLDSVLEEIRKMNKLSTGLLELTRASADSTTVSFDLIRVDDILWQCRANLLRKLPGAMVEIEFTELPEQEEDLIVQGNSTLLATAVGNIMENGCKYSPDCRVQVSLHCFPDSLRLYFKDKGIGISPEDQPYVFEPFYRSNKAGKISGHGIGLALARRIIHLHKGEIQLESQIGVGTTFFVQLPLFYKSDSGY
jgi:signal transduction histidine kinase